MKYFNCDIFTKNNKNKYTKVNDIVMRGVVVLQDMLNYSERKVDGEKIRIVKYNYNYSNNQIITFIDKLNNYKHEFINVPVKAGTLDIDKLENELKGGE